MFLHVCVHMKVEGQLWVPFLATWGLYTLHFWGGVGRLRISYLPSQSSPIRLGRLASRPKGMAVSLPQHEDY